MTARRLPLFYSICEARQTAVERSEELDSVDEVGEGQPPAGLLELRDEGTLQVAGGRVLDPAEEQVHASDLQT